MASSIPAPSGCDYIYCSSNCCEYTITNESGTTQSFSYTACTDGSVISTGVTAGNSFTFCASGTPDYNPSFLTLDLNGCCTEYVSFQECFDTSVKLRFSGLTQTLNQGETYYIVSPSYTGYGSVIAYEATGTIYSSENTSFTLLDGCPAYSGITTGQTWSYYDACGDLQIGTGIGIPICVDIYKDYSGITFTNDVCEKSCSKAALLYKCSDSSVFYGLVDEDTAFFGAVYVYNGECYSFVEFSGPGGVDLGTPDFSNCESCIVPTPTPSNVTPTPTPTITPTPAVCGTSDFCFRTTLSSLSDYNGNYVDTGAYNGKRYYQGDGVLTGFIYYTGSTWCLSSSLGGTCLLKGASPCYSPCPDLFGGAFTTGTCPTPTPSPSVCQIIDFNAYFECDYELTPTPSVTSSATPTATPEVTPTPSTSSLLSIDAVLFSYGQTTTPTPSPTSTPEPTKTVGISGVVTYTLFDQGFESNSVKVLRDCTTNSEYYVSQPLVYNSSGITLNKVILAVINGQTHCLEYVRDDSNLSSNVYVSEILNVYNSCLSCGVTPTPTPTKTKTPTPTPTHTMTPTPSLSSNMVHVFETCYVLPEQTDKIQLIQNQPYSTSLTAGNVVKDSENNCWVYLGVYPNSYIAPIGLSYVNYSGNYFSDTTPQVFENCSSC